MCSCFAPISTPVMSLLCYLIVVTCFVLAPDLFDYLQFILACFLYSSFFCFFPQQTCFMLSQLNKGYTDKFYFTLTNSKHSPFTLVESEGVTSAHLSSQYKPSPSQTLQSEMEINGRSFQEVS